MKKKYSYTILFSALVLFSACGDKKSSSDETSKEDSAENAKEEGPKRLTVADINIDKPWNVDMANKTVMGWEGKTVDVAGYVYTFYGDSAAVDYGSLTIMAGKGSNKHAVSVYLKDKTKKFKVHRNDMIHLRGKISGTYFDTLVSISDAEVISIAPTIKTDKLNPDNSKAILDAGELQKDYTQWNNAEIAVRGNYFMTTTSTTSYGVSIRVDLKAEKSSYADVGCEFKEDPSAKLEKNREGVIIRGKIKPGGTFGKMQLYDCVLVNR